MEKFRVYFPEWGQIVTDSFFRMDAKGCLHLKEPVTLVSTVRTSLEGLDYRVERSEGSRDSNGLVIYEKDIVQHTSETEWGNDPPLRWTVLYDWEDDELVYYNTDYDHIPVRNPAYYFGDTFELLVVGADHRAVY